MRTKMLILSLGFLFWISSASAEILQPGSLDPTYGVSGLANPAVGTSSTTNAAVLQTDGKVVVAGSSIVDGKRHFTLARYTTDGKLDPSFGQNGIVILNASEIGGGNKDGEDEIKAMILQGDKILVGGYIKSKTMGNGKDLALARFDSKGALDNTFASGNSIATVGTPIFDDEINSIDFQSDGKIIVNVLTSITDVSPQFVSIGRFSTDGVLDVTFGTAGSQGFFKTDAQILFARINAIKVQSGSNKDKILFAGYKQQGMVKTSIIGRIDISGKVLDNTFLQREFQPDQTTFKSELRTIALQPDGKNLFGGVAKDDFVIIRCDENCREPNFEFAHLIDLNGSSDVLNSIALQSDGKIIALGSAKTQGNAPNLALMRLNTDGNLDPTFNRNGRVVTVLDPRLASEGKTSLIQSDGKILAAGSTNDSQNNQFAVARYFDKPTDYTSPPPKDAGKGDGSGNGGENGGGSGGCAINSTNPANLECLFLLFIPLIYIGLRSRKLSTVKR